MGGLPPQVLQFRHAGFDGGLRLPQPQALLCECRLERRDLLLLQGGAGCTGLQLHQQAPHPLTQAGEGGLVLSLALAGGLDLLGEAPQFRLVPVDLSAEGVERLLRGRDGLFLL